MGRSTYSSSNIAFDDNSYYISVCNHFVRDWAITQNHNHKIWIIVI